jgi:DNA-binding NtrC family response regulator
MSNYWTSLKILHYNDEEKALHRYLKERGQENVVLPADADVLARVREEAFDAAFIGLHPHGLQSLRLLQRRNADCLVTIITSDQNARMAVEAMKLGAFDYLYAPLNFADVERTLLMLMREFQGQRERLSLEGQLSDARQQQANQAEGDPQVRRRRIVDEPPLRGRLSDLVSEVEARAIRQALLDYDGNLTQAAAALQISRTTLYAKMQRSGIPVP